MPDNPLQKSFRLMYSNIGLSFRETVPLSKKDSSGNEIFLENMNCHYIWNCYAVITSLVRVVEICRNYPSVNKFDKPRKMQFQGTRYQNSSILTGPRHRARFPLHHPHTSKFELAMFISEKNPKNLKNYRNYPLCTISTSRGRCNSKELDIKIAQFWQVPHIGLDFCYTARIDGNLSFPCSFLRKIQKTSKIPSKLPQLTVCWLFYWLVHVSLTQVLSSN